MSYHYPSIASRMSSNMGHQLIEFLEFFAHGRGRRIDHHDEGDVLGGVFRKLLLDLCVNGGVSWRRRGESAIGGSKAEHSLSFESGVRSAEEKKKSQRPVRSEKSFLTRNMNADKELQPQIGHASSSGNRPGEERKGLLGSLKDKLFGVGGSSTDPTNYNMSPEAMERINPKDNQKNLAERVKDAVGMAIPAAPVVSGDEEIRRASGIFKEPAREYAEKGTSANAAGGGDENTNNASLLRRAREAAGTLREELEQQQQRKQSMEDTGTASSSEGKSEGMLERAKHAIGIRDEDPSKQGEMMAERSQSVFGRPQREGENLVARSKEAWGMSEREKPMEERGREVMGLGGPKQQQKREPQQQHHEGETMNLMDRAKEALGLSHHDDDDGKKATQRGKEEAMGWDNNNQKQSLPGSSSGPKSSSSSSASKEVKQEMRSLNESFDKAFGFNPSHPTQSSSSSQEPSVESTGGEGGRGGQWKNEKIARETSGLKPIAEPGRERLAQEREMDETMPQYVSSSSSPSGDATEPPALTTNKTGGRQTSAGRDELKINSRGAEEGKQKWSSVSVDKMKEKLGWGGSRTGESTGGGGGGGGGGIVRAPEDTFAKAHSQQTDDRRAVFAKHHTPSVDKEGGNKTGTGAAVSPFKIGDKAAEEAARMGVSQAPAKKVVQANDLLNSPSEINAGRAGEGTARMKNNDLKAKGKL